MRRAQTLHVSLPKLLRYLDASDGASVWQPPQTAGPAPPTDPAGPLPSDWATNGGPSGFAHLTLSNNQLTGLLPDSWAPLVFSSGSVELCCQAFPGLRGPIPSAWTSYTSAAYYMTATTLELDLR